MALSIKSDQADRLARELARLTGESVTAAVTEAIRQRLVREHNKRRSTGLVQRILQISDHMSTLPSLDPRSADDIMGYDENGIPF